jgi:glyoxylase-like metal-dependent hydrolase (beta-lactamase superfamily II)
MKNPYWRIISIGYLRLNPYWGEEKPRSRQECTCTLVETEHARIIIDPGLASEEELAQKLYQHSGYHPEDIHIVFLTHFHQHHWRSLSLFPRAQWLMSRTEIRWWQGRAELRESERTVLSSFQAVEEHPLEGIEILPTPGHTHGLTSLMFETREGIVITAGDAVLTFDHFDDREPAGSCEDRKMARRSIDQIAKMADVVIPGHDNFFVV